MLSKKYRLPTSFFAKNKKNRRRPELVHHSPLFIAQIFSSELPYGRYAVVASASLFKKSVVRNRVRRKMYDTIRINKFFLTPEIDCVLHLKGAIADVPAEIIAGELKKSINRK